MNRLAGSSLSGYFAVCQHRAIQGYQSSLLSTWLGGIWLKFPGITHALDSNLCWVSSAILLMHFSLMFQKNWLKLLLSSLRFFSKTTIFFAHCIAAGRGQQLFPTQDEVRGRNSLKNQTCCHGNQNKDFRGQNECTYKSEMRKILPFYKNTLSGKCLYCQIFTSSTNAAV